MRQNPVEHVEKLVKCFRSCVEGFSRETGPLSYELLEKIKAAGEEPKQSIGRIYYNGFLLEFVYTYRGMGWLLKSVLECRIRLIKGEEHIYFYLYDLMHLLDEHDFHCYMFSYIENEARMEACFTVLAQALKKYLPRLSELAADSKLVEKLYDGQRRFIMENYDSEIFKQDSTGNKELDGVFLDGALSGYYDWAKLRYLTQGYYTAFLKGNYKKAIRLLSKDKRRTPYEERLLEFMKSLPPHERYQAVERQADSITDGVKEENGNNGLLPFFTACLVFIPPVVLVLSALYYGMVCLMYQNALFASSAQWYRTLVLLPLSIIFSMFFSYFSRKKAYRIFYKKRYRKKLDYDAILNSSKSGRGMKAFFAVFCALNIVFLALYVNCGLSFYENGMLDQREFFSLSAKQVPYAEMEECFYHAGEYNDFGIWMEGPYYYLKLKDGSLIDLTIDIDPADLEREVLPLFKGSGVPVVEREAV